MRASLHGAELSYGNGVVLHTASAGSIASLRELYLCLEVDGLCGIGAARINIAYLNHLSAEDVTAAAISALGSVDWRLDPDVLRKTFNGWSAPLPAPVRMLIDMALHDLVAKRANLPVGTMLGAELGADITYPTNQTLFWSPMDVFLTQARSYVVRGFTDLKVRVGVTGIDEDIRRIAALRNEFGDMIKLAADANGQWSRDRALGHITALAPFDLAYIEQPVAPGDWGAISDLANYSPIPWMLDESLVRSSDIDALCTLGSKVLAHLKLVKLGGIAATMTAARQLAAAGVPFMIGQMNEGGVATAAAIHVAAATRPAFAELYGADGIEADPATGVVYRDGTVSVSGDAGLGIQFDLSKTTFIGAV